MGVPRRSGSMPVLFTSAFSFSHPFPLLALAVLNKYPNPHSPQVVSVDVLGRTMLDDGTLRSERVLGVRQDAPKWMRRFLGSHDVTYVREVSFLVPSGLSHTSSSSSSAAQAQSQSANEDERRYDHAEPPKLLMASTNLSMSSVFQCREAISYVPHPWPAPATAAATSSNKLSGSSSSFFGSSASSASMNEQSEWKAKSWLAPLAHEVSSETPTTSPASSSSSGGNNAPPLSHAALPPATLFSQSALMFSCGMIAPRDWPPVGIAHNSPIEPLSEPRARSRPQRIVGEKVERWSLERFAANASNGRLAMDTAAKRTASESGE